MALWTYANVVAGGILIGAVYALVAVGLTIVFGVMRVVNFAHGEMVVIGMYVGYWCHALLGLSPLAGVPAAAVLLFALGYLTQRLLVNRMLAGPIHMQFILFIALALIITGMHLVAFSPNPRGILSPASFHVYALGPLRLDATRVHAAVTALVLIGALVLFLKRSLLGRSIRGCAGNLVGAEVVGMRVHQVFAVTAGIGTACAGAAGALVAPLFDTHPYLAPEFTLLAFLIVIIGGLGSLVGALCGGILIGLSEALAALAFEPSLKSLFSYALLILVILARPQGLFGERTPS